MASPVRRRAPIETEDRSERAARERTWIREMRAGQVSAFEALFREYVGPLHAYAFHCVGARADAEEIVQEVFFRVWLRRSEWHEEDNVRAYLYRAVRNQCLDYLKHERIDRLWRERTASDARQAGPRHEVTALERIEAGELMDAVTDAMAKLTPRSREVLVLRWTHHLTNAEVAAVLGISVKGVEIQRTRALRALRIALAPHLGSEASSSS